MKTIKTFFITLALIAIVAGASAALADSGSLSANFLANVNTGAAPLTVHFSDKSVGSPTGWQWDFGDGSSSTLQNPVYTYNTPGTFTVTLTATEGAQSDTICADIVVTNPLAITPTPNPVIPVIVQPILLPVRSPHYIRTPHDAQPPTHRQPDHKDQSPVHKQPVQKSPGKPTDRQKHR
jgi:PKD repeat protein